MIYNLNDSAVLAGEHMRAERAFPNAPWREGDITLRFADRTALFTATGPARIGATILSILLHGGALLTIFLLGRASIETVRSANNETVHLVAPLPKQPPLVRQQSPQTDSLIAPGASTVLFDEQETSTANIPIAPTPIPDPVDEFKDATAPNPESRHPSGNKGTVSGNESQSKNSSDNVSYGAQNQPPLMLTAPHATYTEEARRLRIKGTVVLRVLLTHDGGVRVLDIVQRLGHGLDESARDAVQALRFEPARKQGKLVDYITTLKVIFDLT